MKKFNELVSNDAPKETSTDCRTETGITVGLIDGMIAICRILKSRLNSEEEIVAALADLQDDEDLKAILDFKTGLVGGLKV